MPKRVMVLTSENPERLGGMESFVSEFVRGLEERGYATQLYHKENSLPGWLRRPEGPAKRTLSDLALGWQVGARAERDLSEDAVAVVSNSVVGWHTPRSFDGLKQIHFFHGTYRAQAEAVAPFISEAGKWKLKWWDSMMLERLSGKGKYVLCNSDQTAAEVRQFFGLDARTVWLPLDVDRFSPADREECRRRIGVGREERIGLFVGSTSPMKNFATVRRLMTLLPKVFWVLVMRGSAPTDLDANFKGILRTNVAHADLPTFYNAADFAICPSLYEPFGYVVAESLACGTPVIASPGGASKAFLQGEPFGKLFINDPASADGFAQAVQEVLGVPDFYRQKVLELIRPKLAELMAPENWWRRFFEVTGLPA